MKYLKYIIGIFVFVFFASWWIRNRIESNTPPFVLDKLEKLKADNELMDSIGGFRQFEYSYNKEDFKRGDTVKFSIKISGTKYHLNYSGTQVQHPSGNWELFKDTLIIQ